MGEVKASVEQLKHVIRHHPVIDNHAHNLLKPEYLEAYPLESITTEAQGSALKDTSSSLSHIRAARQLRELYGCDADADWEAILSKRSEWLLQRPDELFRKCLRGTCALLLDDGLDSADKVHEYEWHDAYTRAPTKQIVRIERVAELIVERFLRDASEDDLEDRAFFEDAWLHFNEEFERTIHAAIDDEEVAGFKSVVCYRSGLRVPFDYAETLDVVGVPFEHYIARCLKKRKYRIARKPINDYIVLKTLELLTERTPPDSPVKPLQFHTGLGDSDISLLESNPAYLQPLIEQYDNVPFVLLHSAYPYTREAGYLATVYKNVYLDLGEVFPMVSRDGQESIIRQALEITPGSKLLFSTDGHWFPETYWLANRQFREAMEVIVLEYVHKKDLDLDQAITLVKQIYFDNANKLYQLNYPADFDDREYEAQKSLPLPPMPTPAHPPKAPTPARSVTPPPQQLPPPPPPPPPPSSQPAQIYDVDLYEKFRKENPSVQFVYVQWLDYTATLRTKILPIAAFEQLIKDNGRIGIGRCNMGTLQNDRVTPAVTCTGQIYVEPDLTSLGRVHGKDPLPAATVFGFWRDESGAALPECPRGALQSLLAELANTYEITLQAGFEIEVTFLRRQQGDAEPYAPLTRTHAWGTLSPEQWTVALPLLGEISTALLAVGVPVQQFHAESGPGQYEFILPPLPPLQAVDTLVRARQVIVQIAATHGLRATLHPRPLPSSAVGTAAHAHLSLTPSDHERAFWVRGVLAHLEAVCAFVLPEAVSYERVVDDGWTGGRWVCWGRQNRETPLRRVERGRWEVRCLDGCANMYLALAAVVAAGIIGLRESAGAIGVEAEQEEEEGSGLMECPGNPSGLTPEERERLGIRRMLPASIEEALGWLERDEKLKDQLGGELAANYLAMKREEQKMLAEMEERERRVWLLERY